MGGISESPIKLRNKFRDELSVEKISYARSGRCCLIVMEQKCWFGLGQVAARRDPGESHSKARAAIPITWSRRPRDGWRWTRLLQTQSASAASRRESQTLDPAMLRFLSKNSDPVFVEMLSADDAAGVAVIKYSELSISYRTTTLDTLRLRKYPLLVR